MWCHSRLSVQLRCSPVAPTFCRRWMKNRPCTWLTRSSPRPIRSMIGSRSLRNRIGCTTPRVSPRSAAAATTRSAPVEVHRDGDLDERVLARLQRGERHVGVGLARARDDHDVDLGIGERLAEVGRPLLVAVLARRTARWTAACGPPRRRRPTLRPGGRAADDRVQLASSSAAAAPRSARRPSSRARPSRRSTTGLLLFSGRCVSPRNGRPARPGRRPARRRSRRTAACRRAPRRAGRAAAT